MSVPPQLPPDPYGGAPWGAQPYPYGYPPAPRPTNAMAIASLVCAFLFAPLGIVFGHISLSQIRRTGEEGHGLAVAGLVLSYLITAFAVLALIATVVFFGWAMRELDKAGPGWLEPGLHRPQPYPEPDIGELPPFTPSASVGAACAYPASGKPADRPAKPPRSGRVPTDPAEVDATMATSVGVIGLRLDNAQSPCTVNSFVSLAQQGFYDHSTCHRLTASNALSVLQCGDPTASGTGGPGYRFDNEYPTNEFPPDDPKLQVALRYPRGTLAMANAGPDTNGSQFFIVWKDSKLPPTYTVFGKVDEAGMAIVDRIASAGVAGGNLDGPPKQSVTVDSIRLD